MIRSLAPLSIALALTGIAACSERAQTPLDAVTTPDAGHDAAHAARDAGTDGAAIDAFAVDAFGVDAFAPDAFAPDAFTPLDAFTPDAFAPVDAFVSVDAYRPVDAGPAAGGACARFDECGPGLWCDFERALDCGALSMGTCTVRPAASTCVGALHTVCGCDGNQYFNTCAANAAGTDVQSVGVCP